MTSAILLWKTSWLLLLLLYSLCVRCDDDNDDDDDDDDVDVDDLVSEDLMTSSFSSPFSMCTLL